MTDEELVREVSALPPEGKRRLEDFIAILRQRDGFPQIDQPTDKKPLESEEFIGMWRDREEMSDSVEWVQKVRESEWVR